IRDTESWTAAFLEAAQCAEAEARWLDAAAYYHQVEFFLPAGDLRNSYYDDFACTHARGMEGAPDYERVQIPYPGGHLPGFRLPAHGRECATLVFHGGYDSFVEEFYPFLRPLTELGFTVIGFDGPGQGGALRQGILFEHAWEKPARALLDHFALDAVEWLGASCGGDFSLPAGPLRPPGKRVSLFPATHSGPAMMFGQMWPRGGRTNVWSRCSG